MGFGSGLARVADDTHKPEGIRQIAPADFLVNGVVERSGAFGL